MPRGVPAAGARRTKDPITGQFVVPTHVVHYDFNKMPDWDKPKPKPQARASSHAGTFKTQPAPVIDHETDEQVEKRINQSFHTMSLIVKSAISGDAAALIISGPPGLGKSWTVEQELKRVDPKGDRHEVANGYSTAVGLLRKLFIARHKHRILVLDDIDSIFADPVALNLLKAACDRRQQRRISYLAENNLICDVEAVQIPRSFTFEGTIIFITNLDFDAAVDAKRANHAHLAALMSRAHYISLAMRSNRDYMCRIKQVVKAGMLRDQGLDATEEADVLAFIEEHRDELRELSLRMCAKVGDIRKSPLGHSWKLIARETCCRK